ADPARDRRDDHGVGWRCVVRRRGASLLRRGVRSPGRARPCRATQGRRRGARRLMRSVLTVIWRLLAFIGKELVETVRRPGAIVSLIVVPFVIMALFGAGFSGIRRPLDTIVVAPASSELPADPADYQALAGTPLHIDSVVQDRAAAEARLRAGEVDVLVVAPDDPEAAFRAGKRSTIDIVVDAVDPVEENYATILGSALASAVNRRIIERAVEEGQGYALQAGDA